MWKQQSIFKVNNLSHILTFAILPSPQGETRGGVEPYLCIISFGKGKGLFLPNATIIINHPF
jgi:hypothetical protein